MSEQQNAPDDQEVRKISSFALSEDWLAVVVGLAILVLALILATVLFGSFEI
ncbi:MAG TPA: hypothetical protein H9870_10725 [Candidatus Corynebacterium avicola]|uniref:Uncharacterized protein n=1 Tax=Candidatus Corynebacterium avicola TaxID=2838527 RepID=A0A9D1RR98_9CORY|nr:hypothetical protein [Candidatus Corynebacterium avicola]